MKPFLSFPSERALKCPSVRDHISPYLDQRLTGEEMLAVQQHLQECPACAQECEDVWLAKTLLRSLTAKEPPPYWEASLTHRLHQPESGRAGWMPGTEDLRPPRGRRLAAAMAFSCLAVLTVAAPFAPPGNDSAPVLSSAMSELPEPSFSQTRLTLRNIFAMNSPQEAGFTPGALTLARSAPRPFSLLPPLALTMPTRLPGEIMDERRGLWTRMERRRVSGVVSFASAH